MLLQQAAEFETPVFRSPMITMKFINAATIALEFEFAPTASEYGSMVDIQGIGVLIRGASGIGKSECVLGLIERGYSLVSDDITKIKAIEGRELVGMSAELTRFHMEVRGIASSTSPPFSASAACAPRNASISSCHLWIGTRSKTWIDWASTAISMKSWATASRTSRFPCARGGIWGGSSKSQRSIRNSKAWDTTPHLNSTNACSP